MKSVQLGLIVAIALVALLGSAFWVMAQSAPPDPVPTTAADDAATVEVSAIQAVGLLVTQTVGTIQNECANSNTVQVRANTTVYYCYTLHHTGIQGDEPLTFHNLRTSRGVNRDLESLTLNPGEVTNTISKNFSFTDSSDVDVTNFITWTARPADGDPQQIVNSRANIDVVNPSINVIATIGQTRDSCPSAQSLRIPSGQAVAFCIRVTNQGDITFTNYSLVANAPLNINAPFNRDLAPGATLEILPSNMASFGINSGSLERTNITGAASNTFTLTARTRSNLSVTGTSSAAVDVGNATALLLKTVSTVPEDCSKSNTIQIPPGTRVYYCVVIQNTGVVTLTSHRLLEPNLSIDVRFDYPLRPGESLTVTNDFLGRNNLPIVFGPFEVDPKFGSNNVIGNTMNYNGSSPDGFPASSSANTSVTYPPTPTNTHTPRPPDPTATPTPGPTNTPTVTPIPPSPTPTLTPTFTPITPSPTPTRSYAISLLETPTPRGQIGGIPGEPQQLPVQDPAIATATQIAVEATATAIAAEATAFQLAIENATATAIAETQATLPPPPPDSPLATPTVELGLDAPTSLPTETLPVETPRPGADITVLPPLITVVVGTETPAVVVLVVTSTPDGGEALSQGQRPIVYPTPTATPDFVMVASAHL